MRIVPRIVLAIVASGLFMAAAHAEPAAALLEQAIHQEQTDVSAAIKLYQQIIDDTEAARPAQAQAYYRMAACLAKQGQESRAAELFSTVIQRYADQKATAAKARTELSKLQSGDADANAAPVILATTPESIQMDVDPALNRIEVTFDRPMRDRSWSWTGGGDTYPQLTGRPSYDAKHLTCTMPVKLQPGKVYWVGINSPSHRNFTSEKGVPSPWYIILFATRSADGKPTPLPQDRLREAKRINDAYESAQGSAPTSKAKPDAGKQ